MSRTVVIVQARFGSSRLPGKVLRELAGKTVLQRVLERCFAIEGAADVCCALPDLPQDEPVVREAERCGARIARGPESDVLERYRKAAEECSADVIMRVTSDCPLLDPHLSSLVLRCLHDRSIDYACNNMPRTWPHGLDCEAFSREWLNRAAREARSAYDREHVTPYIRSHAAVRKVNMASATDLSSHRWTLDTAEDFTFLQTLFAHLPEGPTSFQYEVPLAVLARDSVLAALSRPGVATTV